MDILIPTIGLAPSELPLDEVKAIVRREQARIIFEIDSFQAKPKRIPKGQKALAKAYDDLCKALGCSPERLAEILKEEKGEAK